jgi:hypothetical protein
LEKKIKEQGAESVIIDKSLTEMKGGSDNSKDVEEEQEEQEDNNSTDSPKVETQKVSNIICQIYESYRSFWLGCRVKFRTW